jgi:hypothetical protein
VLYPIELLAREGPRAEALSYGSRYRGLKPAAPPVEAAAPPVEAGCSAGGSQRGSPAGMTNKERKQVLCADDKQRTEAGLCRDDEQRTEADPLRE